MAMVSVVPRVDSKPSFIQGHFHAICLPVLPVKYNQAIPVHVPIFLSCQLIVCDAFTAHP
jgi:hypothetical protein